MPSLARYPFPSFAEERAPDTKIHVLSPAEVVYRFCEYNLWLKRLAYDSAIGNHLVFTRRKVKNRLSSEEGDVMRRMLGVAQRSVADDMRMVAKIGVQSQVLTSSKYFRDLKRILGQESVSKLRREFGSKAPKELQSWMWKVF